MQDVGDIETGDVLAEMRKNPQTMEASQKLDLHVSLLKAIDGRTAQEGLTQTDVGGIELDIACGVNDSGRELKASDLSRSLVNLVNSMELSGDARVRLMMLYLSSMANVPEQLRQKLIAQCNLSPEDNVILRCFLETKLADMSIPESQRRQLGQELVHRRVKTKQTKRFKQNAKAKMLWTDRLTLKSRRS